MDLFVRRKKGEKSTCVHGSHGLRLAGREKKRGERGGFVPSLLEEKGGEEGVWYRPGDSQILSTAHERKGRGGRGICLYSPRKRRKKGKKTGPSL